MEIVCFIVVCGEITVAKNYRPGRGFHHEGLRERRKFMMASGLHL